MFHRLPQPAVIPATNDPELWKDCGLGHQPMALFDLISSTADYLHQNAQSDWWVGLQRIPEVRSARKIFIVAAEGLMPWKLTELPENVYAWDSVLHPQHPRLRPYMFWFDWARDVAEQMDITARLTDPNRVRPHFRADCLLGRQRRYRDFVYQQMHHTGLADQTVLSYFGRDKKWLTGCDRDGPATALATPIMDTRDRIIDQINTDSIESSEFMVRFQGPKTCLLSMLLPWRIYNDSWFSIVTESTMSSQYFTEKTAKAMIGRRAFVLFGGQHCLRALRHAGFQTFHPIIDESYDDEADVELRMLKAWQQIEILYQRDPREIYQELLPRLVHNQHQIMSINWRHRLIAEISQIAHA